MNRAADTSAQTSMLHPRGIVSVRGRVNAPDLFADGTFRRTDAVAAGDGELHETLAASAHPSAPAAQAAISRTRTVPMIAAGLRRPRRLAGSGGDRRALQRAAEEVE